MSFNSFDQAADYLKKSLDRLDKAVVEATDEVGDYLVNTVKNKHGKRQPWRPKGTNSTPLLKTGKLRDSVTSRKPSPTSVTVYTEMEWLALIHEFGVTYKMTEKQRKFLFATVFKNSPSTGKKGNGKTWYITIPPRPIWRNVLKTEAKVIQSIVDGFLEWVFT